MAKKICLIEDEDHIRQMLEYALRASGYTVEAFASGKVFWQALPAWEEAGQSPGLLLLDVMLPGEDGLSILTKLRANARWRRLPIILLTAKTGEYDKILGLDGGADDYVTKPFSILELLSRIKALLRRSGGLEESGQLHLGILALDRDMRTLEKSGERVELTYKEFELLAALMENSGRVLTRDVLLERIWGLDYDGESRTVDMHIRSLRKKLGDAGSYIQTQRNLGYKMEEVKGS